MDSYNEFAEVYDLFMEDVDYNSWCEYIRRVFEMYGASPVRILDTACGTGNITIPMSAAGYDMWGLDLSESMLALAENKARAAKRKIKFLNQDMVHMNVKEKFQSILCMCDGVNYITEEADLKNYFLSVYASLEEKGIFIFDISSYNKIHSVLGNNTFHEEKNNRHYIWNNNFDEASETIEMDLIFFVPQGELYRKFEEQHIQKAYQWDQLYKLLLDTGFVNIKVFGDFGFDKPDEESERIFFSAMKE